VNIEGILAGIFEAIIEGIILVSLRGFSPGD
jgi:hypothetical protein